METKVINRDRVVADLHKQIMALKYTQRDRQDLLNKFDKEAVAWFVHEIEEDSNLLAELKSKKEKAPEELSKFLLNVAKDKASPSLQRAIIQREYYKSKDNLVLPSGSVELKGIAGYLVDIVNETDDARQRQLVTEALLKYGLHFLFILENLGKILPETLVNYLSNLTMKTFTEMPIRDKRPNRIVEEDIRRALLAMDLLDYYGSDLIEWASDYLLALPIGHPLRDDKSIQQQLLQKANDDLESGNYIDYIKIAQTLLLQIMVEEKDAHAIVDDLLSLVTDTDIGDDVLPPEFRSRIYSILSAWNLLQAKRYRDTDPEAAAHYKETSNKLEIKINTKEKNKASLLIRALNLEDDGHSEEAADLLSYIPYDEKVAAIEAKIRLNLEDYERAVELLEQVLPTYEARYLNALSEENVRFEGQNYTACAVNLAYSYAFLSRWENALETLDRSRSLRIRHKIKLRRSPDGSELLKLEAMITTAVRGVPDPNSIQTDREKDPLGYRLSSTERALELYRKKRPDLKSTYIQSPTVTDIGSMLAQDEAIVSLGFDVAGLMIVIVLRGDTEKPGGTFLLKDFPYEKFSIAFTLWDTLRGWEHELHPAFTDKRLFTAESTLEELLQEVDREIGKQISKFLRKKNVSRTTIVPHRMLHVIPFWALPSFEGLDVRIAPSIAQWYEAREKVAVVDGKVTSIGNPTLDLPLAAAEAQLVKMLLADHHCQTHLLLESDAYEDNIRNSIRESTLFHFAGHGRARATEPLLSALLTSPDQRWGWPMKGDPLSSLAAKIIDWEQPSEELRYSDLEEGRLIEEYNTRGELTQRRLEHASRGTLFGQYHQGELLQLSELWTTSDILIEDIFSSCSVAYLSACESGYGSFRANIDEDVGLPSALQISGVDSVICTIWPVSEKAALLFSQLFYQSLVSQPKGCAIDLAALIDDCRHALATMHKNTAIEMLREISKLITNRIAGAHLNYIIDEIEQGSDYPFEHPWHWAAFFMQGVERLELIWE